MDGQHDIANVFWRVQAAQTANVVELSALRIETTAGVAIVRGKGRHHLRNGKAGAGDLCGIEEHLVLHRLAAQSGIVRHPGDRFILALDNPIFDGLQLKGGAIGALQYVAVDQAGWRKERRDRRRHSRG